MCPQEPWEIRIAILSLQRVMHSAGRRDRASQVGFSLDFNSTSVWNFWVQRHILEAIQASQKQTQAH